MFAPVTFSSFSRPTWAEIDLSSLRANARLVRGEADTPLIAVVKANAYGHGAAEIVQALLRSGEAELFAVASIDEGRALRGKGITAPLLILSTIRPEEAATAVEWKLTPTITNLKVARALDEAAKLQKTITQAHWKIDTGMGRGGSWCELAADSFRELEKYSNICISGIYTHFSCADEPEEEFTAQQITAFTRALHECGIALGCRERLIHAANSAAALRFPQAHYEAVRCGIALYGVSPFGVSPGYEESQKKLRPVMSLKARVTDVREIKQGRAVSYGATWKAARDSLLALVPIGYADGYPRRLSNTGEVLLRGRRCPVVGRVSMDQILLDVTDFQPKVGVGEVITAWGVSEEGIVLSAEEVADKAGMIAYELLCNVSARVPRIYGEEK